MAGEEKEKRKIVATSVIPIILRMRTSLARSIFLAAAIALSPNILGWAFGYGSIKDFSR
jgi:hypothetical protein